MPVHLATQEEVARRISNIRNLLRWLVQKDSTLTIDRSKDSGVILLYAHAGGSLKGESHSDSYFRCCAPTYYAQYHELWKLSQNRWQWHQAYLSIARRPSDPYQAPYPVLCLHVDPFELQSGRHWKVKRCPHFHIDASEEPLPHFHFALDRTELNQMLRSVAALEQRFTQAIKLIRHQLLDLELEEDQRIRL
jgi:hypothetical protein